MSDAPDPELRDRRAAHRRRRSIHEPAGTLDAELRLLEARAWADLARSEAAELERLERERQAELAELHAEAMRELLRDSYGPAP